MQFFARPCHLRTYLSGVAVTLITAGLALAPQCTQAQDQYFHRLLNRIHPMASPRSGTQGHLGVLVEDVNNDTFTRLRLTDKRGAVITLIDHDAPAGQIGLRVNDVILAINGQTVENAAHFGAMLRDIPAGTKISMLISRDGDQQTVTVQLVDRRIMERDVWNKMNSAEGFSADKPDGLNILPGSGSPGANPDAPTGGFHVPFFGSELHVGAIVEPLTSQMSDYLGIPSGILVKQVTHHSEAEAAGLREYDIVLRVGTDAIKTTADWDRALKQNQGKQIQVAILRDRRQQTLNLQVDNKHRR
jgi:S1-C subfamily serine protease